MASGIGSCGEDEASEASEGESERFLNSYPSHQAGSLPMVMANGIQVGKLAQWQMKQVQDRALFCQTKVP